MYTVYLDTSVLSLLVASPGSGAYPGSPQHLTKLWWETARPSFEIVISELALEEIARGNPTLAARRLAIAADIPLLEANHEVYELVEFYSRELGLTGRARADIPHIAFAVAHDVDFLLTWDSAHLANVYVQRRLEKINAELGRPTPAICTPESLMITRRRTSMSEDPTLDEVRAARQQLWDECGQDYRRLFDHLRQAQQRHPERIITREQLRERVRQREAAGVPRLPKEPPYIDPVVEEVHRIRQEIAEERARKSTQE